MYVAAKKLNNLCSCVIVRYYIKSISRGTASQNRSIILEVDKTSDKTSDKSTDKSTDKKLEAALDILSSSLLALTSDKEMKSLLLDLCTPAEIDAMAGRLSVVGLLKNNVSYRKIQEQTGVSVATITRVARALNYGQGGLLDIIFHNKFRN